MRKLIDFVLLSAIIAPVACSCFRDPILDESGGCRVHFSVDGGDEPEGRICLCLFDKLSGKQVFRNFYGAEGGAVRSVTAGEYRAAAWTMDSDRTIISHQNDWNLLSAGSICLKTSPDRIYSAPDHALVFSSGDICIPHVEEAGGPYVIEADLRPVTQEWRIEIEGIKGIENFQGAVFLISGQVCELNFNEWEPSGECTLSESGYADRESGLVICRFGTFGTSGGRISIRSEIRATNGFSHVFTSDVTDQMLNCRSGERIIRLRFETTLHPPVQGGLSPTADEWTENKERMDII